MKLRALLPTRAAGYALAGLAACAVAALLLGADVADVAAAASAVLGAGALYAAIDGVRSWRAWQASPVNVQRRLPTAFALGVATEVRLHLDNPGKLPWRLQVFDAPDARFHFEGLPQSATLAAGTRATLRYTVTALQRGLVAFGPTQLRWRSRGGCWEFLQEAGAAQELRVYPNFAAVAGYAWLAGDRRLTQIGIKTYARRGMGTDFRQLADYQRGEPVRHIDWKATLRQGKPIVRQFQDERDQRVFFLLDCGRRMRADEGAVAAGGSHFDQALNALMLLAYVALKEGDEVGALTFGNLPGQQRDFAPRKGVASLNALMNRLYDIEPAAVHSDYVQAANDLLRHFPRRALVIVLTNFRDEDATELQPAIKLLRSRHLVMVASLREQVLRELAQQPIARPEQSVETATAHLFEQGRRDAFARVTGHDALSVDVEPAQLPAALVNRYHAVKRAGML
ncbi:DUF58 domain-containing protein [Ramlibacter sp. G-1-2-2]|uniref:DUF58 domain-containing protein n=1 Tax=Ramlibacter agri TaxID=2728837 RepID=A0A848GZD6_9BURK|nr:DUF58 domain-containing protein [Ramlibacter agri]NML43684.1 DUF58 domain-containing protein [Ramlibacter agri]